MNKKILIIEDDTVFGTMLEKWFRRNNYISTLCSSMNSAKSMIITDSFDLIVSDLRLPDGDGIMLLQWCGEQSKRIPVIIMTGYAEVQSAVSAIKLGAEDYLEKPINPTILKEKVEYILGKTIIPHKSPSKENPLVPINQIITGSSPLARTMYDYISKVAPTPMSVLLLGESGTGKEYAARMIHEKSTRSSNAFVAVDCGSLSRELATSELFGHVKGAFTSANNDKIGVFEEASGGTLFLDEVGNLTYDVQVQLLRALQERKIRPVGSVKDITIDVRIITATNEDLISAIAEGVFREDLYHRLNEVSIIIPSLRDRKEDIPLFAQEFIRQANVDLNKKIQGFTPHAMTILQQQYWSGNLRELRNVIRRTVLFTNGTIITPDDLPHFTSTPLKNEEFIYRSLNEREQIETALRKARGNKSLAAQLLKIDRKTLYNKMHLYKIDL